MKHHHHNFNTFQTKRSPRASPVRSKHYEKKYQDGLPKLHSKEIITHFPYEISPRNYQHYSEQKPEFWAVATIKDHKRALLYEISPKKINPKISTTKSNFYDICIQKYVNRRKKKHHKNKNLSIQVVNKTTQSGTLNSKKFQPKTLMEFRKKSKEAFKDTQSDNKEELDITHLHLGKIQGKNLYDMTLTELKNSIKWKQDFLHLLENRKTKPVIFTNTPPPN